MSKDSQTKICSSCWQTKPLSRFPKSSATTKRSMCQDCRNIHQNRKYANKKSDPEYMAKRAENQRSNRRRKREEVIRRYGGICACCGESKYEFLSIDHIKGGGGKHRREIGTNVDAFMRWLKKNNWPNGFRILCHNCNSSLGFYGYCPHNNL